MYIPLPLARAHAQVTTDVTDELLQFYIDSAEDRAANFMNRALSTLLLVPPYDAPELPQDVRQAICFMIADSCEHRGSFLTGTIATPLPTNALLLLQPYRIEMGV